MKKSKRILACTLAGCMMATALVGCSGGASNASGDSSKADTAGVKSIYFLNFKPEIAEKYEAIAKEYQKQTGVEVKVKTAASGEYEKTLTSEISKSDPPTIFQLNGPVGYQNWKDYCADLKDSKIYNMLSDKTLAVKDGEGIYGVPYAVEGYGIIYNDEIMQKYFALDGAKAKSTDEITNYDTLKLVVEDMQSKKADLGIDGVFGSTSLKTGDDWRWQTHLMNVPLYYEFNTGSGDSVTNTLNAKDIEFKYSDNYKNIFDLYTNNSCTEKNLLGGKTVDESMSEFAAGKCAMIQNGNWAWSSISAADGNVVKEDSIKYLPIYTGMADDAKQGLCVGTENYFAVNSEVDEATQQASIDFLEWLFSSDYGKEQVTKELGFIAPFTSFTDAEKPSDPLAKEVLSWMEKDGVVSVPWVFAGMPSETWKTDFGASLLEYVQGQKDWSKVVDDAKSSWTTEREATAE